MDPRHSGINFSNTIVDNDTLNVLDVENIYNGGGVGIGDFNNDGLQDVYFAGNMVSNKLYLNKGNFEFNDVTNEAAVTGEGHWCRGVSVIDINNDGRMDIYLSASLMKNSKLRENILYINQGTDAKGIPHFKNMATAYRLNDTSHSTMAAFFDYDNDGDLDMYQVENEILKDQYPNTFRTVQQHSEHPNTDKLFRNDWNAEMQHPVFTNVSAEAGITIEGYGHGVSIADINRDGWQDIYVTNDFLSNNTLYINNHNGTFTNEANTYLKHTSENSMGQDIVDINNDGLADIIEADMNPEDNFRKKMMMNPLGYQRYKNNDYYNYQYQYVRNVLQLNCGPRVEADTIGAPIFADIAFYAGIAETDWSWTPSIVDFDNDGYKDVIITNGFPKDVTDHDFIAYRNKAFAIASRKELLEQIPQVKISNYAYKNNGDLTFSNVTGHWGLNVPTFSSGAAYADFDNDGDLDYVINNINQPASLYRNNAGNKSKGNHFIQFRLHGDTNNVNGIGAHIELHYGGKTQAYDVNPFRGYLSTVQYAPHFGLGSAQLIDSVVVEWPGQKQQVLLQVKADSVVTLNITNAHPYLPAKTSGKANAMFATTAPALQLTHHDSDFVDFNIQKLLPHKFSEYGPALVVGDVDGNQLDDLICGGSMFYPAQALLQQPGGKFITQTLFSNNPGSVL